LDGGFRRGREGRADFSFLNYGHYKMIFKCLLMIVGFNLNVFPSMIAGSDSGASTSSADKLLLSSMCRKLMVKAVIIWFLMLELFI